MFASINANDVRIYYENFGTITECIPVIHIIEMEIIIFVLFVNFKFKDFDIQDKK